MEFASIHRNAREKSALARRISAMQLMHALASLRLTLVAIVALGAGSAWIAVRPESSAFSAPLIVPLLVLAANLLAALATHATFRRQSALLVFHLCLLALVILAALSRLTYLKGTVELGEGEAFQALNRQEHGIWHRNALPQVRFVNRGFVIDYLPGVKRNRTVNRVVWWDDDGVERQGEIGDQTPLVVRGYRFYTTFNKGFSALMRWEPTQGPPVVGRLNMPSYPLHAQNQTNEFRIEGLDSALWLMLKLDDNLIDPERVSRFRLPDRHEIVLRAGERQAVLQVGEALTLPDGRLRYLGLSTWMGYSVFYDWTIPWLLATSMVAVLALAWHFRLKFAAKPWRPI
ncbi:MAG TPA: cytochrome c biogenesis protein ResB [Rhodocyclaceae bacterium]|nr:cytochrome c biogenesis protein ResB [Rhodocyclaceae bacterium]